jgi:hypothetical protein
VLPLAAVAAGRAWPEKVDHRGMASFNLVLVEPDGITAWTWDAVELRRLELGAGIHMITSRGVDGDDAKTAAFAPRFAAEQWLDVVTSCAPADDLAALVVRHPFENEAGETDYYATVFGQLITAAPGELRLTYSRTPWVEGSWTAARRATTAS